MILDREDKNKIIKNLLQIGTTIIITALTYIVILLLIMFIRWETISIFSLFSAKTFKMYFLNGKYVYGYLPSIVAYIARSCIVLFAIFIHALQIKKNTFDFLDEIKID